MILDQKTVIYYAPENDLTDLAIKACVELSDRYITDKYLPDKAIDVMDEVVSRTHINNINVPDKIVKLEKKIISFKPEPGSAFVMYLGNQKGKGFGPGKTTIFIDSGFLIFKDNSIRFDGVFIHQSFRPNSSISAEKKSSDQLILTLNQQQHPFG